MKSEHKIVLISSLIVVIVGCVLISMIPEQKRLHEEKKLSGKTITISEVVIDKDEMFGKYKTEWVEMVAIQDQLQVQGVKEYSFSLEGMKKILKSKGVGTYKVKKLKKVNSDTEIDVVTTDVIPSDIIHKKVK